MMKLLFAFLIAPLFAFTFESALEIIPDETTLPILNPALKDQKTLKIRLANGLEAVLISDPQVKQSSVTLSVMAGSWQDPDKFPGLAHFLEHMLFLGTKEYPEESAFERYVSEHGGKSNAFTHGDFTSYIFSVQNSGLPEALKRFASFFKDPLFNPSGIERELHAIDQEFDQSFNNESMRAYYVLKYLSNKAHPGQRFQAGNSTTLRQASTDTLRQWFEEHYSANLMRLYVLSALPLDELKAMVAEDFSSIPNRHKQPFSADVPLLPDALKGHMVWSGAKKNVYSLNFFWEIPANLTNLLDRKPEELLCYVLGHEGKESLFAELKREGLAFQLGCGNLELSSRTYWLVIQIKLTAKGFENLNLTISRVYQAIKRLKQDPFPFTLYNEIAQLAAQRYQFQERSEPFEGAQKQSYYLVKEPLATYPELSHTIPYFDPVKIAELLAVLTPENAVINVAAPENVHTRKLDQKDPWMQVPFAVEAIKPELIRQWSQDPVNPAIKLPEPNPYVAYDLKAPVTAFKPKDYPHIPAPVSLLDKEGIIFYYSPDPFYHTPRTFIRFDIQSPAVKDSSPQAVVLAELYALALKDRMNEMLYEGKTADSTISLERTQGAIQVTLEGFSDSIQKLFPAFIQQLVAAKFDEGRFNILKEGLQKEYENLLREMPIQQTFDYFKAAIYKRYTTNAQKRAAISKLGFETFQKFAERFIARTFIKGVIAGSLPQIAALRLIENLDQSLHESADSVAPAFTAETVSFPADSGPYSIYSSTKAQGDALLLVIEAEGFSPALRNQQQILTTALSTAFFTELRTKQQTGYTIASNSIDLERHLFNYFAGQSSAYSAEELLWRFEQFIERYLNTLESEEIPPERFEALKISVANSIQDPPPSLNSFGELQFKLAFEIRDFDWLKNRLRELSLLDYPAFTAFCKSFLGRSNKRRLAIMLQGQKDAKEASLNYTPLAKGKKQAALK